nr:uncharacterized protein LOC124813477 [Hydra vulgaris]
MVSSCGVLGCSLTKKKQPDIRFFRLPGIINYDEDSRSLSEERRRKWLASLNRTNLSQKQLSTIGSTLLVCGKHFINGKPAKLFEKDFADWVPTLYMSREGGLMSLKLKDDLELKAD